MAQIAISEYKINIARNNSWFLGLYMIIEKSIKMREPRESAPVRVRASPLIVFFYKNADELEGNLYSRT